ncbi:MAG: shikimate dehydrogenase [Methanoregula sp.]|jgi:shikimate dehydrogenase|uniref:shikimate dehydrogenase n=1 Tax=Methanoregula sp. TaxID=2052170 RepID=UPI0025F33AFE|nr:shikimate dehydrogenase [Methanoregula sp.]MCK9632699.1 shikimate dehydrogenase [Methanoregula sp.]
MKRIVLTGYRGTGKTEIGKQLAQQNGVPFLDTDTLIEQETGRSIPDIFHEDGEERFRAIEREVIASLPPADVVIGTGGGAVVDPKNMEHLRKDSTLVLLTADIDTIERRILHSSRPPLTNLPMRKEIAEMMDRRRQHYHAASDFYLDTSDTTPADAAGKIASMLKTGVATAAARAEGLTFFRSGRLSAPVLQRLEEILKNPPADPQMRILGVAGYPCAHSRGPRLFNALFREFGLNNYYTFFEDPELDQIMTVARSLDVKGLSVTIPFKQDVIPFLDEVDEHAAQQIGAVNTVVFACGSAIGYNTDWLGIRKPLVGMKGAKAVLLGAGGGASAAAYALVDLDMDVTILNRTPAKAKELAQRAGCRWAAWDAFDSIRPDLVVNTTPLGMEPDTRSPLTEEQLYPDLTVYDLVYTPPITPLIERARAKGCTTITGTGMFVEQAREQFYLWFGIDLPEETLRKYIA